MLHNYVLFVLMVGGRVKMLLGSDIKKKKKMSCT